CWRVTRLSHPGVPAGGRPPPLPLPATPASGARTPSAAPVRGHLAPQPRSRVLKPQSFHLRVPPALRADAGRVSPLDPPALRRPRSVPVLGDRQLTSRLQSNPSLKILTACAADLVICSRSR